MRSDVLRDATGGCLSLSLSLSKEEVVEEREEEEEERKEGSRWYFSVTRSGEVVEERD